MAKRLFSPAEHCWLEDFSAALHAGGAEIVGPTFVNTALASLAFVRNQVRYCRSRREHGIDLQTSFVIGDSAADVLAAYHFGARVAPLLVLRL